jgi:hypothetical protein
MWLVDLESQQGIVYLVRYGVFIRDCQTAVQVCWSVDPCRWSKFILVLWLDIGYVIKRLCGRLREITDWGV